MEPTLKVGDGLLVDKQSYGAGSGPWWMDALLPPEVVKRGDIVVFHYALDPGLDLVKRVVGLPGDRVHLHGGRVFVNGVMLVEPYAFYAAARPNGFRDEFPSLRETDPNVESKWWMELRRSMVDGEVVVPKDSYFVLGDNRNDSADSRYWGFVPRSALIGRPLVVDFAARGFVDRTLGEKLRYWGRSLRVLR
jgi:signal peptidase I